MALQGPVRGGLAARPLCDGQRFRHVRRRRPDRAVDTAKLVGVKTWAVAHLITNGDLGGVILFGAVLAWAVYDRISLKHRGDPGAPPIPEGGLKNDIAAVVVGVILYLALGFVFHPLVVGRHVFGATAFGT